MTNKPDKLKFFVEELEDLLPSIDEMKEAHNKLCEQIDPDGYMPGIRFEQDSEPKIG